MFTTASIWKELVNYRCKHLFNSWIIFNGKDALVGAEEIMNIRLQVCEFELKISTF